MNKASFLVLLASSLVVTVQPSHAGGCSPSDPLGNNSGNLCPLDYTGVHGGSFNRTGVGFSAYYGPRLDPLTPGTSVINGRLNNEFFTSIEAGDATGGITIKTNKGSTYTIRNSTKSP